MTLVLALSSAVLAAGLVTFFLRSSRSRRPRDEQTDETGRYACTHCSETDCICTRQDD